MANFSYVVDSSYKPFSLQEMLVPFTAYKEEFEKAETAYTDLTDKADKFKYLSETLPEGSKARQLYEGYANNLKTQAEDLAHNGLTRANKTALTSLKRRFQGEIGRVAKADEAMEAEKKLRQTLNAQDSSRLYAMDNLNVDDFLDGKNPNLYSISGNELYTRGAAAGKAASSRVYKFGEGNLTLGGYYRDLVSKVGYGPQAIAKFREDISSNPELAAAVEGILAERGVNENLTGNNLERARQSVINGIIDGAIYQENHTPQRDLGKIDAGTQAQLDLTKRGQNISLASQGFTYDENTGTVTYDRTKDPTVQKAAAIANAKEGGHNSRTSAYNTRNKSVIMVGAETGARYRHMDDETTIGKPLEDLSEAKVLSDTEIAALVDEHGNIINEYLRNAIGNGDIADYEIAKLPAKATEIEGSGYFSDDETTEDIYIVTPRETKRAATENESSGEVQDIPK